MFPAMFFATLLAAVICVAGSHLISGDRE